MVRGWSVQERSRLCGAALAGIDTVLDREDTMNLKAGAPVMEGQALWRVPVYWDEASPGGKLFCEAYGPNKDVAAGRAQTIIDAIADHAKHHPLMG